MFDKGCNIQIQGKGNTKTKNKGEKEMKKSLNEVLEMVTDEQWQDLYSNLGWERMGAILNQDGSIGYRIEDNQAEDEDEIVATLALRPSYWADTLTEWGLYDEENSTVDTEADQETIKEFIDDVLKDAFVGR